MIELTLPPSIDTVVSSCTPTIQKYIHNCTNPLDIHAIFKCISECVHVRVIYRYHNDIYHTYFYVDDIEYKSNKIESYEDIIMSPGIIYSTYNFDTNSKFYSEKILRTILPRYKQYICNDFNIAARNIHNLRIRYPHWF